MAKEQTREELLDGIVASNYDDRVVQTVRIVGQRETVRERLSAALDLLAEDVTLLLDEGDVDASREALTVFLANKEHWMDMVLGPNAGKNR